MADQTITMQAHDTITIQIEGGRTVKLWLHECSACDSLDIWMNRGRKVEEISSAIGDTTRAPFGLFTSRNGMRFELEPGVPKDPSVPTGRGAIGTTVLLWKDAT